MIELKEGDPCAVITEVTAVHPEWIGVRVTFGRMVQNIRVDKAMVQPVALTDREINADLEAAGEDFDPRMGTADRLAQRNTARRRKAA